MTKTLYADFNDVAADGSLPLSCQGSVASIAALVTPIDDGEDVWLSDGDLLACGKACRRPDGSWEVQPGWRFVT
jgi:hypothetical protein